MTNGSNAVAVKALIATGIKALNPEWDFSWGAKKNPERMYVFLGEITWDDTSYVTNRSIQERFTVTLIVNHKARRKTAEQIETDTLAVIQAIQAWVKSTPNFGIGNVIEAVVMPKRMNSWPADDFTECQAEAEISVTARF